MKQPPAFVPQKGKRHPVFGVISLHTFPVPTELLQEVASPEMGVIAVHIKLEVIQVPEVESHLRKAALEGPENGIVEIGIETGDVQPGILLHKAERVGQVLAKG